MQRNQFQIEVESESETSQTLKVSGYLDENAEILSDLVGVKVQNLTIDFNDLKLLNSVGIKLWIDFLQTVTNRNPLKITYKNCPRTIVETTNTISGFLPEDGEIESFYTPVFCNQCDKSFDILQNSKNVEENLNAIDNSIKELSCGESADCHKHIEIDFDPKSYLRFLKRK